MPQPDPGHGVGAVGGPDGQQLVGAAGGYLDYLSGLCKQLGVPDPVEEYLSPVIGRWSALHEHADTWRRAARTFDEVSGRVTKPLGQLDAVWEGRSAQAFVAYMQKFAPASASITDAMHAMADALDHTANSVRELVKQMIDMLTGHATAVSGALVLPLQGADRAREFLDQALPHTKELFDAVHDVLSAFAELCKGMHGEGGFEQVVMRNEFPKQGFTLPGSGGPQGKQPLPGPQPVVPQPVPPPGPPQPPPGTMPAANAPGPAAGVPGGGGLPGGAPGGGGMPAGGLPGGGIGEHAGAPSAPTQPGPSFGFSEEHPATPTQSVAPTAAAPAAPAGASGSPGGMGMMGGGAMGNAGGDQERKSKSRTSAESAEIFGKPEKTAPPVIGA